MNQFIFKNRFSSLKALFSASKASCFRSMSKTWLILFAVPEMPYIRETGDGAHRLSLACVTPIKDNCTSNRGIPIAFGLESGEGFVLPER